MHWQKVQYQATEHHHLPLPICLFPQVTELEALVGQLQDAKEVTGAAVNSLEATLARLERAESLARSGSSSGACSRSDTPRRGRGGRGDAGGKSGSGEDAEGVGQGGGGSSLVAVSRELVKSQMAAADLQRKLRVAAR